MLKGTLSGLRKFSVTESPLKLKALYFTLNTLFIFKVFKFLPLLFFGHVEKKFDKVRQIRLISKFMTSQPGKQANYMTHIIFPSKGNQTMKFGR